MADEREEDLRLNKATRLAIAGAVAPSLREAASTSRARRVALVDEDGNVTGYTTLADVQQQILERAKIELAVTDGKRPDKVLCQRCGKLVRPPKQGAIPKICAHCRIMACVDCGAELSRTTALRTKTPRCKPCADKARALPKKLCRDCGTELSKKARQTPKIVRCVACSRVARRKPLPVCARCGKALSPSARVQDIRHCRACFRNDPAYLAKVRVAVKRAGRIRWERAKKKKKGRAA